MWAEVILTYAMIMSCKANGYCDTTARQVPIKAEIIGKFTTMEECAAKAIRDTQLLVAGKSIPGYVPGLILGSYQTFKKPICQPILDKSNPSHAPGGKWTPYDLKPRFDNDVTIPYRLE